MAVSSNFDFLAAQDERLARLGAMAERYFFDDASATLIKLRQLAEFLTKEAAARHGHFPSNAVTFDEVQVIATRLGSIAGLTRDLFLARVGTFKPVRKNGRLSEPFAPRSLANQHSPHQDPGNIAVERCDWFDAGKRDTGQSLVTHEGRIALLLVVKGERYPFPMPNIVAPKQARHRSEKKPERFRGLFGRKGYHVGRGRRTLVSGSSTTRASAPVRTIRALSSWKTPGIGVGLPA
jgi:hypothetical protein